VRRVTEAARIRNLAARTSDAVTKLADGRRSSPDAAVVRRIARLPQDPIPVYWWASTHNFGDRLSPAIVEYISGGTAKWVSRRYSGKVLAVGSVLHHLSKGDVVWGSGSIAEEAIEPQPDVKFCAVRGPLTRGLIRGDVPEVYGDPAMLLPRLYQGSNSKRFSLGVIPHHSQIAAVGVDDPAVSMISVRSDWREVVDRITECEVVASSSLHGLIVAEAYGIPAFWFNATTNLEGSDFKFRDYYLSTGREPPRPILWNGGVDSFGGTPNDPPELDLRPLLAAWPSELNFK
jgi:pyruvyltransferase